MQYTFDREVTCMKNNVNEGTMHVNDNVKFIHNTKIPIVKNGSRCAEKRNKIENLIISKTIRL